METKAKAGGWSGVKSNPVPVPIFLPLIFLPPLSASLEGCIVIIQGAACGMQTCENSGRSAQFSNCLRHRLRNHGQPFVRIIATFSTPQSIPTGEIPPG